MRPKKSAEKIKEMLTGKYGSRVDIAGTYHGRRSTCLFFCHDCDNWFWQNVWSLQQGFRTRCECNHDHRLPEGSKSRTDSGHRCLPEWECYDRVKPERS
jgi:hypothetical protein